MQKSLIRTQLRNILADNSHVMSDAELDSVIDLAVYEYSMMKPTIAILSVTTTTGIVDYVLDDSVLGVLSILNSANTITSASLFGQSIRFSTDPGTSVYTVTATAIHVVDDGNYPTIPLYDLGLVLDIGTYTILERIADDIARRPDIVDGQTSERWGDRAQVLYNRAAVLRTRVFGASGMDDYIFVG